MNSKQSADGRWINLKLADNLFDTDIEVQNDELACIVVKNKKIIWIGPQSKVPSAFCALPEFDGKKCFVTPGLIDCHTHLIYGGNRANEFAMRMDGASYEEISRKGGGIASSVNATRLASEDELVNLALPRLDQLLKEGVTAIEIKSGYGLSLEHERKQLRAARRLSQLRDVTIQTTFLGAHALPMEYSGRSQAYIDHICDVMMPALFEEGLIDTVDVFCEKIGFSLKETEQVFQCAKKLGIPVKLHAEQLSNMEGAELAASYNALSCDHIEYLSEKGICAMEKSGTVAVLLPGAFYALNEQKIPPIQSLRNFNVPMAIATDHNPGTSPCLSLLLMANMACTLFKLSVSESLAGITVNAAKALNIQNTQGVLASNKMANFVLWQVSNAAELIYFFGHKPAATIVRNGNVYL